MQEEAVLGSKYKFPCSPYKSIAESITGTCDDDERLDLVFALTAEEEVAVQRNSNDFSG